MSKRVYGRSGRCALNTLVRSLQQLTKDKIEVTTFPKIFYQVEVSKISLCRIVFRVEMFCSVRSTLLVLKNLSEVFWRDRTLAGYLPWVRINTLNPICLKLLFLFGPTDRPELKLCLLKPKFCSAKSWFCLFWFEQQDMGDEERDVPTP